MRAAAMLVGLLALWRASASGPTTQVPEGRSREVSQRKGGAKGVMLARETRTGRSRSWSCAAPSEESQRSLWMENSAAEKK